MNLLGFSFGGSGLRVGGGWGWGWGRGGSLVGVGVLTGGLGLTVCMFCSMLSGQSRLLEGHFWLNRACWKESVVTVKEPVMELKLWETVMYKKMHSNTIW